MERSARAPNQQTPDDGKLRELILHLATECANDAAFGAVKLQKLLFYSDFTAYVRLGRSITGGAYKKLKKGPVLTRSHLLMESMRQDGDLHVMTIPVYNHVQKRPIALRAPSLSQFSADEIEIAHTVIRRFWGMTAAQISMRSHAFIGWRVMEYGEEIPYALALVGLRPITERMRLKALELDDLARRLIAGAA